MLEMLWSWLSVTIGSLSQLGSGKSLGERVPSRRHSGAASDWRNIYIVWQSMRRTLTWKGKQWSEEERRGSLCGFSRVSNRQRLALVFTGFEGCGKKNKKSFLVHACRCGSERTVSERWSWKESRLKESEAWSHSHTVLRCSADSQFCSGERVKRRQRFKDKATYFLDPF